MATPQRTCIGCRTHHGADKLVRIVRAEDGSLAVRPSSAGRGAWLCADSLNCLEVARRRKAFSRAFRAPVSDAAVDRLRRFFEEASRTCEDG